MEDVLDEIESWLEKGEPTALATVVATWGASPRGVGAKMAFTAGGRLAGSVSGGCIETAVIEAGREVIRTGEPRLLHLGVTDDVAWGVGLSCGGSLDVFVERLDAAARRGLAAARTAVLPQARITVIAGARALVGRRLNVDAAGQRSGGLGDPELEAAALDEARAAQRTGRAARVTLAPLGGSVEVFVDIVAPAPMLVIVGGVHIAIALATIAEAVGYRTVVIDPRRAFGSQARFPHVGRLLQAWPDEALPTVGIDAATAIAMLTHDPKIDEPALSVALRSPAFYVGALGSRQTQAKRRQRLLAAGLTEAQVDRIHAPIGLDIGARTPEEIALAIMAEVVASRSG